MEYEFYPGTLAHLVTLAVCGLVMLAFVLLGRRLRGTPGERRLRHAWVIGQLGLALAMSWRYSRSLDLRYELPLHLCDVAFVLSTIMLWRGGRGLRAVVYFWAFSLSTQAFVTPILRVGPSHAVFWVFWIYHVQLVGAALYDVVVGGFRPERRDFLIALAATLAYGALMIPFDVLTGWSYGFVGPDDSLIAGTVLEYLPPWPWRLAVMFVLITAAFAVLWGIWPLARRLRRHGD